MRGWGVYFARLVLQRLGRQPPKAFADKRVLVGITFLNKGGKLIEQFQTHGRVVAANGAEGIVLVRPDGGRFVLPPSPEWLRPARPGEYRLRSTGEVVQNVDYLFKVTLSDTTADSVENVKKFGFEGPFRGRT